MYYDIIVVILFGYLGNKRKKNKKFVPLIDQLRIKSVHAIIKRYILFTYICNVCYLVDNLTIKTQ